MTSWIPALMICVLASTANAQLYGPPSAQPSYFTAPNEVVAETEWYGWKIALADAAALGFVVAGAALSSPSRDDENGPIIDGPGALVVIGVGSWFSVTPLVHLTERNVYGAGLSYGLRLALPTIGALVGTQLDEPGSVDDPYASGGILIGMIAASAIDIGWIAQQTRRHVRPAAWVPQVAVTHRSVGLGVSGAF